MKRLRHLVAAAVAVALVASACGSSDPRDSSSADPAPSSADEPDPTPTAEPAPSAASDLVRVVAPSAGIDRARPSASAPVTELTVGLNQAGMDLWALNTSDENFVFSPMSVGHALLMARGAADEVTGAAIDEALGLPVGVAAHEAWNAVDDAMGAAAAGEIDLSIADAIFPRIDVEPDQAWVDLLTEFHGVEVQSLDFDGDSDGSRDHINGWVAEQTEQLIPELLPPGFVKPTTVLALADAVYFKARWQTVFGKYGTVDDDFTLLDGSTVKTSFMRELELASRRGRGDGFAAVEIPYVGLQFSMQVIVPEAGRFHEIRARLHDGSLDAEVDAVLDVGPFELWLPAWETTSTLDLLSWLQDIGASPGNYPAITPAAALEAGVHAADIAVDEWGTVAAAATALGFEESGPPEPEIEIKADKPFLYLIRHLPSGLVLFAGQVTQP